jgi:excisionase family DNA binding protein
MTTPTQLPETMTATALARRQGVSARTVRRWIRAGHVEAFRCGRDFLVSTASAARFFKVSRVAT